VIAGSVGCVGEEKARGKKGDHVKLCGADVGDWWFPRIDKVKPGKKKKGEVQKGAAKG